jgi:hypothetical protein
VSETSHQVSGFRGSRIAEYLVSHRLWAYDCETACWGNLPVCRKVKHSTSLYVDFGKRIIANSSRKHHASPVVTRTKASNLLHRCQCKAPSHPRRTLSQGAEFSLKPILLPSLIPFRHRKAPTPLPSGRMTPAACGFHRCCEAFFVYSPVLSPCSTSCIGSRITCT